MVRKAKPVRQHPVINGPVVHRVLQVAFVQIPKIGISTVKSAVHSPAHQKMRGGGAVIGAVGLVFHSTATKLGIGQHQRVVPMTALAQVPPESRKGLSEVTQQAVVPPRLVLVGVEPSELYFEDRSVDPGVDQDRGVAELPGEIISVNAETLMTCSSQFGDDALHGGLQALHPSKQQVQSRIFGLRIGREWLAGELGELRDRSHRQPNTAGAGKHAHAAIQTDAVRVQISGSGHSFHSLSEPATASAAVAIASGFPKRNRLKM